MNQISTCGKGVDQHQHVGERLKHFSSFGTDSLLQSNEKQISQETSPASENQKVALIFEKWL